MSDATVQNKRLIQNFFDVVVNQRDVGALGNFVREDGTCGGKVFSQMVINPDPTSVGIAGTDRLVPATERPAGAPENSDVDNFRDFTEHVLQAFPDIKVNIDSIIAEGDQVVVRWTATGTHRGEFLGTPPTGRVVPMTNCDIFTVKDGKIVGVLAHPDGAGVLQALGHLPDTPLAAALVQGTQGK
jgi:steroid delta-isomerase-like uncharacterized protein